MAQRAMQQGIALWLPSPAPRGLGQRQALDEGSGPHPVGHAREAVRAPGMAVPVSTMERGSTSRTCPLAPSDTPAWGTGTPRGARAAPTGGAGAPRGAQAHPGGQGHTQGARGTPRGAGGAPRGQGPEEKGQRT